MRGKVEELHWLTVDKILRVVLYKGTGKKKQIFAFTAFSKTALQIGKLKKNDRIKVWFKIETKKSGNNYFNNLAIEEYEQWAVNEDKIKKEAIIKTKKEDHQYKTSEHGDNADFLSQGNYGQGPSEDQM